jgi:hypothetical protein
VALREVRHRRVQLKQLLDETLTQAFNFGVHQNRCWVQGVVTAVGSMTDFNALLMRMALVVKQNLSTNPSPMGLLCTVGIMLQPNRITPLVK